MKKLPILLMITACIAGFATDLPEEQFIDAYDDQNTTYGETYARLTYVGKYATMYHEGGVDEPAIRNLPMVSGDLLETGYSSYAELEFIDGSLLQIADRTKLEAQAINEVYNNESLTVLRFHEGQLFLHVSDNPTYNQDQVFRIDTRAGSAYIEAPGIYMLSYKSGRMKLKTYRGVAELSGEYSSVLVHSGEFSSIRGMSKPVNVVAFNSFRGNAFERWAYDRRPVYQSASARYVDGPVSTYSRDLDDHGEWRYSNNYDSHVWVPYTRKSWRPYSNGYWSPISGRLTWISHDPFGYVTHHYGRWGWDVSFGWYWVPGRYYSPAWVAWTTYDSYIGWCPLGYWNRPYYYRNKVYNTVIINNHNYRWNYISIRDISSRRAARVFNRAYPPNRARRITTRPISLVRTDLRDGRRVARIIRDPELNRRRSQERGHNRGNLVRHSNSSRQTQTSIQRRDSGTKATTRYASRTRQARQQHLRSQGSSILRGSDQRQNNRTTASRSGASERSGNLATRRQSTADRAPSRSRTNQPRETIKRNDRNSSVSRDRAPRRQSRSRVESSPPKQRQQTTPPKRSTTRQRSRQENRPSVRSQAPQRRTQTRSQTPKQRTQTRSQTPQRRTQTRSQTPQRRTQTRSQTPQRRSSTRSTPPKQRQQARPQTRQSKPRATAPKQRQRTAPSRSTARKPPPKRQAQPKPKTRKPQKRDNN